MSVYDSVRSILYVYLPSNLLFIRCVNLLPLPDDFLRTAHAIHVQYHKFTEALSLAIRLGDPELIWGDFSAPADLPVSDYYSFFDCADDGVYQRCSMANPQFGKPL